MITLSTNNAEVVELVDTLDLKFSEHCARVGSNPTFPTKFITNGTKRNMGDSPRSPRGLEERVLWSNALSKGNGKYTIY